MRHTIVFIIALSTVLLGMSCNGKGSKKEEKKDSTSVNRTTNGADSASVDSLVSAYLELKNALTDDNNELAGSAARRISVELDKLDKSTLPKEQRQILDDVKEDIREHAEHIAGSDMAHQREHFDLLSQDVIDLVKVTGTAQPLYVDFCPMFNNKKGASWLSEKKEIQNPYYGKEMLGCGEIREELKAR